jgi:hypothetical protein
MENTTGLLNGNIYSVGDILVEGGLDTILYMVVKSKNSQYGYTLLNMYTNEKDVFLVDFVNKTFRKVA